MNLPLVIYHGDCLDGFGAAYAAYLHFQRGAGCEFYPAHHGNAPPDCAGREVYIIDFSYRRAALEALCQSARQITLLDHHITAQQDLAGLSRPNLRLHFNLEKSGAVLAWEYFHQTPPPYLLQLVQDRDLWRFVYAETAAVNAALMSYPYDLALWDGFMASPEALQRLVSEGETIIRYRRQLIDRYKEKAVPGVIAGVTVPIVNCPMALASELLGELAEGQPFAAGYEDSKGKRKWSLRSRQNGADVAKIAELFGGGGHRQAAGFATPLPQEIFSIEPKAEG